MIKSIRLDGFRHFHDLDIQLRSPYTLICGLNGTGKTTVIEVLNRLQRFLINGLPAASLCSTQDIPAWENSDRGSCESSLSFEIENGDTNYSYSVVIKTDFPNFQAYVEKEKLDVNGRKIFENRQGDAYLPFFDNVLLQYSVDRSGSGLSVSESKSSEIKTFLQIVKSNLFSLSINPYNIPSYHQKNDYEPILNFDASNFSAWYHSLINQKLPVVAQTFSEMGPFIPGFRQFILNPEGKSRELVADIFIPPSKTYRLPFESLSHGQKVLSILHLLVRTAPANSTIAIDELENFLAPTELQPLYDAFQDAYEDRDIQFILISHHPKTLSWFTDSAIVLSFAGNPPTLQARNYCEDDEAPAQSLLEFLSESE